MSKIVTVKTTCTGTIYETWRFRVPDDWEQDPDEDQDALDALLCSSRTEMLDVADKTDDEQDRDITDVSVEPEPAETSVEDEPRNLVQFTTEDAAIYLERPLTREEERHLVKALEASSIGAVFTDVLLTVTDDDDDD